MTPKMEMILQQIVPVYDKQHFCRQPPIFVKSKIIEATIKREDRPKKANLLPIKS